MILIMEAVFAFIATVIIIHSIKAYVVTDKPIRNLVGDDYTKIIEKIEYLTNHGHLLYVRTKDSNKNFILKVQYYDSHKTWGAFWMDPSNDKQAILFAGGASRDERLAIQEKVMDYIIRLKHLGYLKINAVYIDDNGVLQDGVRTDKAGFAA